MDEAFDPNPVNAKVDEKVTWTNDDSQPHTVTSGRGPMIQIWEKSLIHHLDLRQCYHHFKHFLTNLILQALRSNYSSYELGIKKKHRS
jgi:plastocyanin